MSFKIEKIDKKEPKFKKGDYAISIPEECDGLEFVVLVSDTSNKGEDIFSGRIIAVNNYDGNNWPVGKDGYNWGIDNFRHLKPNERLIIDRN